MNKLKLLLIVAVFGISSSVQAAYIDGSIGFNGTYSHDGTADISDATTITPLTAYVGAGSVFGTFALEGVTGFDPVVYSSFTFNPITVPVANIWSVGGFSFTLESMTLSQQDSSTIALTGLGLVSKAGYEDTKGFWTFTANQNGASLTFSSGTNDVPEPSIIALFGMGLGLLGLGAARRRMKK